MSNPIDLSAAIRQVVGSGHQAASDIGIRHRVHPIADTNDRVSHASSPCIKRRESHLSEITNNVTFTTLFLSDTYTVHAVPATRGGMLSVVSWLRSWSTSRPETSAERWWERIQNFPLTLG